jgi:FdhD protein
VARTTSVLVTGPDGARRPDKLIVEEPLAVSLDGHPVTTTMRTPGDDVELAAGFVLTEGLLAGAPVREVRMNCDLDGVEVRTGGLAPVPTPRLGTTTSSCGVCGVSDLAALKVWLSPLAAAVPVAPDVLAGLGDRVRAAQSLFDATGSVHAAATFDPVTGELGVVREDIGRHNAVDKVVGRLLLDGRLPATGTGLFVSGRASFEIVQKAWAAGIGLVAAVSGPSSLAVSTAKAANISLVGFLRGPSMTIYTP